VVETAGVKARRGMAFCGMINRNTQVYLNKLWNIKR